MGIEKSRLQHRSEAVQDGITDWELSHRTRRGELIRVTRGSYIDETQHRDLDAVGRHRALVHAVAHRSGDDVVFSHISAAAIHGFDLWKAPLHNVHLTHTGTGHGSVRNGVHRHYDQLDASEVVSVGGLSVTTAARNVADLARMLCLESAVVTGDHALHLARLTKAQLEQTIASAAGRKGAYRARLAVSLMDERSESVGESLSRLTLRKLKLPAPDLQKHVWGIHGQELGRTDFYFPGRAVVGEFDGRVKYGKYLKPGQQQGDAIYLEKLREDRIRDTGLVIVRWIWTDLQHPQQLRLRILKAFERGRREIRLNPALAEL